jgi:hypothetical protein
MEKEPKTLRERAEHLIRLLVPDWRPVPQQVLWAIKISIVVTTILLAVLLILYLVGLLFGITVYNLLKVLAVPITIGAAVPLLNWLQKKRELDLEQKRAQDEALQAYLDQMSQLLTDKDRPLRRTQLGDDLSIVVGAKTKVTLIRLNNPRHSRTILLFLREARLIDSDRPIINLWSAVLKEAALLGADLSRAAICRELTCLEPTCKEPC